MRILTAGESHGEYLAAILEGFPKGVKIEAKLIDQQLRRRMAGPGRGRRMAIESDKVQIISGLRNKISLGSPIAMLVKNKDAKIFTQRKDKLPPLNVARPAHADLAGALKYRETDVRNILERASARETAARVCVGSACRQFLSNFNIVIVSAVKSLGEVSISNSRNSKNLMLKTIKTAKAGGDTLGGVIEVRIKGVIPGLGTFMHYDRRLDAKLAASLMGIPAIKGVEVGLGFAYALRRGSQAHDVISHKGGKFSHLSNNSGGIEGGISNGEPIILRLAMKPISTLAKPLNSVNLRSKKKAKAPSVRSDTSAVFACGVIAESMSAIVITEAFLDKFGSDSLKEIRANYDNYCKTIS